MCNVKKNELSDMRKQVDQILTAEFIQANKKSLEKLAKEFSKELHNKASAVDAGSHFYLKGSNAISILKGVECTSDFDFQYMPGDEYYNNWKNEYKKIDEMIRSALKTAVKNWKKEGQTLNEIDDQTKKSFFDSEIITKQVKYFEENPLTNGSAAENETLIGQSDYMTCEYHDIIRNEKFDFATNRLKLTNKHITTQEDQNLKKGIYMYVNYTIPGFILYRLVYAYKFTVNGINTILKSEMIDVSVPRPGSAERFMSQEGFVTHFKVKNEFKIPGWGYHFYENINLLQEIVLGYSGSVQKKEKRTKRLQEAITHLLEVNGDNWETICGQVMKEDENPENNILGYAGALTNYVTESVSQLDEKQEKYLKKIQERMLTEVILHQKTVAASKGPLNKPSMELFTDLFVNYGTSTVDDTHLIDPKDVLEAIKTLNLAKYEVRTPLVKLDSKNKFQILFVILSVDTIPESKAGFYEVIKEVNDNNNAMIVFRIKGGAFYVAAFKNVSDQVTPQKTLPEILSHCILFSQRVALGKCLERK